MLTTLASIRHQLAALGPFSPNEGLPGGSITIGILTTSLGLFVLMLVAVGIIRRDRDRLGPEIRQFCQDLNITPADRRLLSRIASANQGSATAALILSHGSFTHALGQARLTPQQRERARQLRQHLFGKTG